VTVVTKLIIRGLLRRPLWIWLHVLCALQQPPAEALALGTPHGTTLLQDGQPGMPYTPRQTQKIYHRLNLSIDEIFLFAKSRFDVFRLLFCFVL